MTVVRYTHQSRAGLFAITSAPAGRWLVMLDGESLGSYHSPEAALAALCGGHCDWPAATDPSTLQIPVELADWTPWPAGRR